MKFIAPQFVADMHVIYVPTVLKRISKSYIVNEIFSGQNKTEENFIFTAPAGPHLNQGYILV